MLDGGVVQGRGGSRHVNGRAGGHSAAALLAGVLAVSEEGGSAAASGREEEGAGGTPEPATLSIGVQRRQGEASCRSGQLPRCRCSA